VTEYLKSKQHYIDLYDKHTVETCRRLIKPDDTDKELLRDKKITKKQAKAVKEWAQELFLKMETGERYLNKEKVIQEWIDEDRRKDDLYENAQAPEDIRCLTCRNRMIAGFKQLWYEGDKPERVLFMYDCPNKCMPRRAFFSDGEEWRTKPHVCKNCSTPTTHNAEDDGKKLVTTYTCPKCKYVETDEYEWSSKKEDEFDEHFATDRDRFCLSEAQGAEYREFKWSMEGAARFMDEWKEKDKILAERLEKNPKGFHREGAGYTCSICHDSTPEGDNWYDKWGVKCLVCQKAIDKGEIPASLAKNDDSWYRKYDFEHYFNIKGQTLNKWVKEGIVISRTVTRYGEGVHTQVFLIKDNKDFLPPKKLLESKRGRVIRDGKETIEMRPWYQCGDPYVILKGYKIMDYLRVLPPEEVAQREEEQKAKYEARRLHREKVKSARAGRKKRK
jgi:hypothetical protein